MQIDGKKVLLAGQLHLAQNVLQFKVSEGARRKTEENMPQILSPAGQHTEQFDTQIYAKGPRKLTLISKGSPVRCIVFVYKSHITKLILSTVRSAHARAGGEEVPAVHAGASKDRLVVYRRCTHAWSCQERCCAGG